MPPKRKPAAAASSRNAAAPSAAAATASTAWIVPDLALTDANRPRVLALLTDVQSAPASALFEWSLDDLKRDLMQRPVRSAAELDCDIEAMISLTLDANDGRFNIGAQIEQTRQLWRLKITELVEQIGREDAVLTASSTSAAAASVNPPASAALSSSSSSAAAAAVAASSSSPAASTTITEAAAVSMQSASSSSSAAAVGVFAAASLPSSSSAADRVERSLMAELSGSVLADLTVVLQHSRQHSSLLQRIAELESAHAALLSTLQSQDPSMEKSLRGAKPEKADATEALVNTAQLKRKAEDERDEAHKRARSDEVELE